MKTAIIIVDVQNDFVEGGALAVAGGMAIVPIIKKMLEQLPEVVVVTSQDWHPLDHCSFDRNGGQWPVHCVNNTKGAQLVEDLTLPDRTIRVFKGNYPKVEAYSAFDGFTKDGKLLNTVLMAEQVDHVYVCGIALNFCVRATVESALRHGYRCTLVENATAAIPNIDPSPEGTLQELATKGCQFLKAF